MPTNILTTGATDAQSSDVTVNAGSQLIVSLKDAAGPSIASGAYVFIEIKDDAGAYFRFGELTPNNPATILSGLATYRFNRPAGVSCGVFSG
jgi:hypothetical protein